MTDDPHWPRASGWLAGAHAAGATQMLAVLGAPLRLGSITPGRCDLTPSAVRAALARFSTFDVETNRDLENIAVRDCGDLDLAELRPEAAFEPLANAVRGALAEADALVLLGGDNSITRPACHGAARSLSDCALLTLDAHLDLRDLDAGLTNGNPVRALLADGLAGAKIVQIGIQPFANSRAYFEVARAAGITVVPVNEVRARGIETVVTAALENLAQQAETIYVDLDVDVLDRAFAPATPGSRPGGITPAELRTAARVCGSHPKVKVMDLVEVDPTRDVADTTVFATAMCLLAFASGMLARSTSSAHQTR
jgi:formiminoglutamase